MKELVTYARPSVEGANPHLVVLRDDQFVNLELKRGAMISLEPDLLHKYCTGWQDISTHTSHPCEQKAVVDAKYENCFACRQKTDFNPAFYNTEELSEKQASYNSTAHLVYVAYFGGGIAKAGITSESRKLQRLYEQGALLYTIVDTLPNATMAHELEDALIRKGFRNSVTKKQKSDQLEHVFDLEYEIGVFSKLLAASDLAHDSIQSNLEHFFFGKYPRQEITQFKDNPVSGKIVGVVGRYLVLENNELLYGFWLSKLFGYYTDIGTTLHPIDHEPIQASLF